MSTKISDRDITNGDIEETDENSEADNDDLDEKLILSHKTYNTLNKREKKAVKFTNSGTKASGKMYTKTSDCKLSFLFWKKIKFLCNGYFDWEWFYIKPLEALKNI